MGESLLPNGEVILVYPGIGQAKPQEEIVILLLYIKLAFVDGIDKDIKKVTKISKNIKNIIKNLLNKCTSNI